MWLDLKNKMQFLHEKQFLIVSSSFNLNARERIKFFKIDFNPF